MSIAFKCDGCKEFFTSKPYTTSISSERDRNKDEPSWQGLKSINETMDLCEDCFRILDGSVKDLKNKPKAV